MSDHHATIRWTRSSADFTYDTYNRAHDVVFKDGKIVVPSSAAAAFKGDADRVDPEDAFVGSLSSCHMLTFLAICARKRLTVDAYEDAAVGTLEKGPNGKFWMARVTLKPRVRFAPGISVDKATLGEIHHRAHEDCFIAISVKTDVSVEPQY
ncbi:MAG TPA: OsmC family protein [Rhizomicrobium sp.]|nr:OsmC family protein [Rhizomicrobium sp.]